MPKAPGQIGFRIMSNTPGRRKYPRSTKTFIFLFAGNLKSQLLDLMLSSVSCFVPTSCHLSLVPMNLISMISAFPLRMSRCTHGRGRQNHGEGELPPPPTMAQVL